MRRSLTEAFLSCQRCRKHKIKCSGSAPCSNCSKGGKSCVFDAAEPSISVSKRYLAGLEERLAALEGGSDAAIDQSRVADPVHAMVLASSPGEFSHFLRPRLRLIALQGRVEGTANASRPLALPDPGQSLPASSFDHAHGHLLSNPGLLSVAEEDRRHSLGKDVEMTNPLIAGSSDTGFISDISSGRSSKLYSHHTLNV